MEFKIPKFTMKLKPNVKMREWEVNYVYSGRKEKTCGACKLLIPVGQSATTFVKRTTVGDKNGYETIHTCGLAGSNCTQFMAHQLQVELPFKKR